MLASHTVERPTELLTFLFEAYPEAKRTKVRQWLKHGSVHVNGRAATRTNHALRSGDSVSIRPKNDVLAEALLPPGLKVIFEGDAIVVIDKPENLLSIATKTERHQTAYAFLTDYFRHRHPRAAAPVWIVHRLDRESSGVMVFVKTKLSERTLQMRWHTAGTRSTFPNSRRAAVFASVSVSPRSMRSRIESSKCD